MYLQSNNYYPVSRRFEMAPSLCERRFHSDAKSSVEGWFAGHPIDLGVHHRSHRIAHWKVWFNNFDGGTIYCETMCRKWKMKEENDKVVRYIIFFDLNANDDLAK